MKGYGGRVLFLDVGDGGARVEALEEPTARALLGGNGLAARLLLDRVAAEQRTRHRLLERLDARAAVAEINRKNPPPVSLHGSLS